MTTDVKPEVIKRTQELLGKHIKKPPLTEKLLKKPPFRFLHDIVTSVIRGTGFLDGVVTPDEMNHENIKDKEGKIAFLQKIIDAVNANAGIKLSVRPTKIVAGHEPTKTNELLQAIGKAIEGKRKTADSTASQGLPAKKPSKTLIQGTPTNKEASPSSKPTATSKLDKTKSTTSTSQDRTKTKVINKKKSSSKASIVETKSKSSTHTEPTHKEENLPKEDLQSTGSVDFMGEAVDVDSNKLHETTADIIDESLETNFIPDIQNEEHSSLLIQDSEVKRPPSAHLRQRQSATIKNSVSDSNVELGKAKPKTDEENEVLHMGMDNDPPKAKVPSKRPMSVRPPTARPASARPAAPRIRDRGDVPRTDEPAPLAGKVNVITDNDSSKEQDEDDFLVIESKPSAAEEISKPESAQPLMDGSHGHLVAQILETQKDLEEDAHLLTANKAPATKKTDIEWEGGRKRDREAVRLEVEKLRAVVQKTTSIVNPLGKLMDYVLEDVDSMQRELEMWRYTNKQLTLQLREEERLTDQAVEPMKLHLDQLEESIQEKRDQISALKATVIGNDNRITRLLVGGLSKDN